MIPTAKAKLLESKKGLIVGIANDQSIAWGCAKAFRALGAEPVVEGDRVGAQLASRSLDAVIDTIGGDALESTCEALRSNGIIVSVVRPPDEAYLRSKGMRVAYFIVDVTRDRLDRISAMVERGPLNLPVGEVLDLADASTAHGMLDGAPHKPGKIVLKVAD